MMFALSGCITLSFNGTALAEEQSWTNTAGVVLQTVVEYWQARRDAKFMAAQGPLQDEQPTYTEYKKYRDSEITEILEHHDQVGPLGDQAQQWEQHAASLEAALVGALIESGRFEMTGEGVRPEIRIGDVGLRRVAGQRNDFVISE